MKVRVPTPARIGQRRGFVALAICALAYLYPFPYFPAVNNPNENVRFFMTAAIVDDGTYAIDAVRSRWGWVNDAGVYEGRVFSVKAPGTSLLGVPGYAMYRAFCELRNAELDRTTALFWVRVSASILPMLAFTLFFHRWARRRGVRPAVRDAIALSVALGSPLYAYALLFVSHTSSAIVSFTAFVILERARRVRRIGMFAAGFAGFLAAATTAFEYPGFVASAALSLYALLCVRPLWRIALFALGAAIPTFAVLHFHASAFGSPWTPGHRYLETESFRDLAQEGFFGASKFHWDAAGGLLFDLGYGLFPLTPVLFLAFLGIPSLLRRTRTRLDAVVALSIPVATYVLICCMNNWRGGWTIGARYLALAIPFLAYFALEGARLCARVLPRTTDAMVLGAASTGFLASGIPSAYYPHLPEAFTRPLPQLIKPLVSLDFAPMNAGSLIASWMGKSFWGTASMLPLALVAVVAIVWVAWAEVKMTDRLLVLFGSTFFASFLMGPLVANDPRATGISPALAYVTSSWWPEGRDRSARLERKIASGLASERDFEQLEHAYRASGRDLEAQRVERRRAQQSSPRPLRHKR